MNLLIRKRQIILGALVVALGAAVAVNWHYTKPQLEPSGEQDTTQQVQQAENLGDALYVNTSPTQQNTWFADARLERSVAHDEAKEVFAQVIESPEASVDAVQSASASLDELSALIKLEADLETLISAKTGSESIVTAGDDGVKVIVEKGILNDTAVFQIKEVILANSSFSAENITIIEAK
ncbi:MAG: SpoIIIAH-like family protein [Clostridiales bacterium]|nr:SpoIIIAH-like family protein [Clostridiales bacterium]